MRRAKIVCTLGPATSDQATIDALVAAGMDCARLNFSHGTHEGHARTARMVRAAAAKAGRPLAILADLCGPKMRVGRFPGGPVELVAGQPFTLSTADRPGDARGVGVSYAELAQDVRIGDAILLDDGLLRLSVTAVDGPDVHCVVEVGGTLSDKKGLNIPGTPLSTPAVTDKDKADLKFAVETLHVELLALSFVRRPEDVLEARALAGDTPIIAKIEKPEAIENLEAILDVADGAMVARGDLGVELGAEKVPLLQKRIIRAVNRHGKLVITATQMLDSMIRNPSPTRAEAADVANAVLDGTDALMLSGETAAGKHPLLAVGMMDRIIREVEADWLRERTALTDDGFVAELGEEWGFADGAAKAAAVLSFALPMKALVVFTRDGRTARMLSEYRPRAPIVALTSEPGVANRLAVEWGVIPRVEVPPEQLTETVRIATGLLLREGICQVGDEFALVMGWPPTSGTNTLKLHRI
ncbi:MAG: pyruvate kinase [Deltaproteobacteria bacterium]|nr:MAG: pyruvate kinase [Deltaproteobacteria bacterium]